FGPSKPGPLPALPALRRTVSLAHAPRPPGSDSRAGLPLPPWPGKRPCPRASGVSLRLSAPAPPAPTPAVLSRSLEKTQIPALPRAYTTPLPACTWRALLAEIDGQRQQRRGHTSG